MQLQPEGGCANGNCLPCHVWSELRRAKDVDELDLFADTAVGDVQVFLPPDLPLNIEAVIDEAAGHRIFSEFPGLDIQGAREPLIFGTGRVRARCALNGGGKALMIHAVTGNIEIHRLDSQVLDRIRQRQQLYWKALDVRQQRQMEEMIRRLQRGTEEAFRRGQQELEKQEKEIQDELRKQQQDNNDDND